MSFSHLGNILVKYAWPLSRFLYASQHDFINFVVKGAKGLTEVCTLQFYLVDI